MPRRISEGAAAIGADRLAYVVLWEAKAPDGSRLWGGARRVLAETAQQAEERARAEIANEMQKPLQAIDILEVRPL